MDHSTIQVKHLIVCVAFIFTFCAEPDCGHPSGGFRNPFKYGFDPCKEYFNYDKEPSTYDNF